MSITRSELVYAFRGLGLRPGAGVMVHSSLSSIGHVEGGADAVVGALLDTVGPEGTVAVPTFTRYGEPYDVDSSRSTTGAIAEALRSREAAVRSLHPTKSVAAIGPTAASLVSEHGPSNSLGPGSPLHRLLDGGGAVLLLGVDHTANSAVHVAERLAGVPYRDQMAETAVLVDGSVSTVEVNRVHCSRGFEVVRPLAEHAGIVSRGLIGDAETRLLNGERLLSLVVELLEAEPGALLCSVPDCERCAYARRRLSNEAGLEP